MDLKKIHQFYSELRHEITKIVWPESKETLVTFLVVLIVIVSCSLFFLFFDYIVHKIITLLLNIGK